MATKYSPPQKVACDWRFSMEPAYTKLARTLLYLVALGVMTAYVVAESGSATILLIYMIGVLVVYGVDHVRVEYGRLTFELGNKDSGKQE